MSHVTMTIMRQNATKAHNGILLKVKSKAMRNCFFYAITSYVEFWKYRTPDDGNLP